MNIVNIQEVLNYINPRIYTKISGDGMWLGISCLFKSNHPRGDRRPSAYISISNTEKSYYYCHGCGQKGQFIYILSMLERLEGLPSSVLAFAQIREVTTSFTQALITPEEIEQRKYLSIMQTKHNDYTHKLKNYKKIGCKLKKWLYNNGISNPLVLKLLKEDKYNNLAIPLFNMKKECIGIKIRPMIVTEGSQKYYMDGVCPTTSIFYPEWIIDRETTEELVLVEGELDALHVIQYGIPSLAILGTSNWNAYKKDRLLLGISEINAYKMKKILLLFDNDPAGSSSALRLKKDLERHVKVKITLKNKIRNLTEKEIRNEFEKF
jgi:DNA primase